MGTVDPYPSALIADSAAEHLAQELARQEREADEFRMLREAEQREFERKEQEKALAARAAARAEEEAQERAEIERQARERALVEGAREAVFSEQAAQRTAQMRAEEKAKRRKGIVNTITSLIVCGALVIAALLVFDLAQTRTERAHAEITEQSTQPTPDITVRIVPEGQPARTP